jgi:microcystin-dependent protein
MDPFIAEIRILPYTFAPRGWARCDGQIIAIAQNTALFSLVGTTYGGNGQTTFALPNLAGRVPVHRGQGPGLSDYSLGEMGGEETVTLTSGQVPSHSHPVRATLEQADSNTPSNTRVLGRSIGDLAYKGLSGGPPAMSDAALSRWGGNNAQPHNNVMPFVATQFCIALQGVFPSRP